MSKILNNLGIPSDELRPEEIEPFFIEENLSKIMDYGEETH